MTVRVTGTAQTALEVVRHDAVDDGVDTALDVGQEVDHQL